MCNRLTSWFPVILATCLPIGSLASAEVIEKGEEDVAYQITIPDRVVIDEDGVATLETRPAWSTGLSQMIPAFIPVVDAQQRPVPAVQSKPLPTSVKVFTVTLSKDREFVLQTVPTSMPGSADTHARDQLLSRARAAHIDVRALQRAYPHFTDELEQIVHPIEPDLLPIYEHPDGGLAIEIPVRITVSPDGSYETHTTTIRAQSKDALLAKLPRFAEVYEKSEDGSLSPGVRGRNNTNKPTIKLSASCPMMVHLDSQGRFEIISGSRSEVLFNDQIRPDGEQDRTIRQIPPGYEQMVKGTHLIYIQYAAPFYRQRNARGGAFIVNLSLQLGPPQGTDPNDVNLVLGRVKNRYEDLFGGTPTIATIGVYFSQFPGEERGLTIHNQGQETDASYTNVRVMLQTLSSFEDSFEQLVVNNLPSGSTISVLRDNVSHNADTVILQDPLSGIILGVLLGGEDASIFINNSLDWDYNAEDGIQGNAFNFEGTLTHEVGHALGFNSVIGSKNDPPSKLELWDLFRIDASLVPGQSASPTTAVTTAPRMLTQDVECKAIVRYFDSQGAVRTSTGSAGDGRGAPHWKDNVLLNPSDPDSAWLGLMDPTSSASEGPKAPLYLARRDLLAFDVMGYVIDVSFLADPAPPDLQAPADGENGINLEPTLQWSDPPQSLAFVAYVYEGTAIGSSGTAVYESPLTTNTSVTVPPETLQDSTVYTWLVRANYSGGFLLSDPSSFITQLSDCAADVNASGAVEVNDISYVLFRLGNSGAPGTVDGDANLDGVVDVNDINYVLFRLGTNCSP